MIDFVKPNATAVERVIEYSILLRDIKITLLQLRRTFLMIRGLRINTLGYNGFKEYEFSLQQIAMEIQNSCRQLLSPLLEGIDFGHAHLNHWAVSMYDIRRGYCELEEITQYDKTGLPQLYGRRFILLLYDYTDPTLGKFYAGELISLEKASHFINDIPERKDKTKGLYDAVIESVRIAMVYKTINKL